MSGEAQAGQTAEATPLASQPGARERIRAAWSTIRRAAHLRMCRLSAALRAGVSGFRILLDGGRDLTGTRGLADISLRAREALRSGNRIGRRVGLRPILASIAFIALLPVLFLAYAAATIPSDGGMAGEATPSAVIVSARDGQVFATRGIAKGEKMAAGDLPRNLKAAIVAIEDRRFYSHNGIDLRSIGRALLRNAGGGREGASTLTQQLARLTYLSQERSLRRKTQEAMLRSGWRPPFPRRRSSPDI